MSFAIGKCVGTPEPWDLTQLGGTYEVAISSIAQCHACPVFDACRSASLSAPIPGMISAAVAYDWDGNPIAPRELRAYLTRISRVGNRNHVA
ncbi:hypothetical protein GOEFS_051_00150 [Gordonia effusa NBRC 100432]|uniref:4Fe-4S Wbl-type domain-containing protein n=1 Tax=Gordonia effusa NBRC 100432 TaxID=1077974 RepID=H0QZR9_9ACTN|nr:hypothetical protein [Gordonia effusa]GAB18320.1 hypothetical protein GOEFS_051_00150 [Gordonia effusa NBRC 100432]